MPPLTELQIRTLVAAIDRIVPADDFPSASDAGCLNFLLRIIELEHLEDVYRAGLDALELEAAKSGKPFADCASEKQDAVLAKCQTLKAHKGFVDLLVRQTIEGYYSDPGNGGNKDGVAWEMVGFKVTA